jgi:thioredoxin-related protein
MNEENQLLTAVPGYYPPEQMEPILKFFGGDHYKTTTWEDFSKNFKGEIEAAE